MNTLSSFIKSTAISFCCLLFITIGVAHAGNSISATVGDYKTISYIVGGSNTSCFGIVDGSAGQNVIDQWTYSHYYSGAVQVGPFYNVGTFTFACYGDVGAVDYTFVTVSQPPTETCWDGSVITPSYGQSCPALPPIPTVSASISPTNISYGGNFNSMSYSSANASYCNYGPTSYTWGVNGPYYSNQTWTFVCYNVLGQSAQQSVTLNVCQPPTPTWNGSACIQPITVTLNAGNFSTFGYSSTNATACSGSGIVNGNLGGTNNAAVSTGFMDTPGTYTQSVSCTGPTGSVTSPTRSLTVIAWPPANTGTSDASGITFSLTPLTLAQPGNASAFFVINTPSVRSQPHHMLPMKQIQQNKLQEMLMLLPSPPSLQRQAHVQMLMIRTMEPISMVDQYYERLLDLTL
jgi:hypothetical protein